MRPFLFLGTRAEDDVAQQEYDAAVTRLRQADEALLRARALTPTPIDDDRERYA